jgi:GNAT superfamily N-acetyltransferase
MVPDIRPLTPDLWPAFEDLFGKQGACYGCWCTYFRLPPAARRDNNNIRNKDFIRSRIERGPPPGLLAFNGDVAVGWCQLTARDQVPELDRAWRLTRVDDLPVWSLSCFYVRKGYRRQGITSVLIAAALKTAQHARAPALEAYPLDRTLTPSTTSTGIASTFERAGFKTVACRVPPRPIMRHDLKVIGP